MYVYMQCPLSFSFISCTVDNSDYTPVTMELAFTADTLTQTVEVDTSMDMAVENLEMFTLSLTSTDSAVTLGTESATVSITDQTSE